MGMRKIGHMDVVIEAARRAGNAGEVPVAAAIVDTGGRIISLAENRMKRDANATYHAEILALNAAMAVSGKSRLDGFDLWVSLEPCAMCCGLLIHSRIENLIFAALDPKSGAVKSNASLLDADFINHKVHYSQGPLENQSSELLKSFFRARRL